MTRGVGGSPNVDRMTPEGIIGGKYPQRTTLWLQNEASEVPYLKGEKRCLKAEEARRIIGKEGIG